LANIHRAGKIPSSKENSRTQNFHIAPCRKILEETVFLPGKHSIVGEWAPTEKTTTTAMLAWIFHSALQIADISRRWSG